MTKGYNHTLALNMIVKASDDEAVLLSRCLTYIAPHVDAIYLTITGDNKACEDVAKGFGAKVSHYKWNHSFADARNFALSQVPDDYDFWMWLDCDDVLRGAEKLRATIDENLSTDAFIFNYLYAFDEHKLPIVVHTKTRVLRHDGCVEWAGDLHEDFKMNRKITSHMVNGIEVLHLTDDDRIEESRVRNVEVAEKMKERNPDDPRSYWNLGNAYKAAGLNDKAEKALESFLKLSHSDEEKYIIRMRLAEIKHDTGRLNDALDDVSYAIGLRPDYPDAYHLKGALLDKVGRLEEARDCYLQGLMKKPPYHKIIVFNPRAYDYAPMMALAKIYFKLSQPHMAHPLIKGCLKIYPKDENLKKLDKTLEKESKKAMKAYEWLGKLEKAKDDEEFMKIYKRIKPDYRSHPVICHAKNIRFVKKESSGKDLVIFCGYTEEIWTPETARTKGIGGSEEAVIHLSQGLSKLGWNVTVYANCGHKEFKEGKVKWKPFWSWNYRDKQDVVVLWRSPKMLDHDINCDKVCVDLHDVIDEGELNEKRIEKVYKLFVKSPYHRGLFPNVPDDKFAIIENGIVWEDLQQDIERKPNLMVCTSSPDRHLSALLDGFERIKKEVPGVKCKWAYGWGVWDVVHGDDRDAMEWKRQQVERIKDMDGFEALGRVSHGEVAKLYQQASVFAYPTAFAEIDCISARKAQAGGAALVTTNFAALENTVVHGVKVPVDVEKENWGKPYQYNFSLKDTEALDEWVKETIKALKNPLSKEDEKKQREDMKQFDWSEISKRWDNMLK